MADKRAANGGWQQVQSPKPQVRPKNGVFDGGGARNSPKNWVPHKAWSSQKINNAKAAPENGVRHFGEAPAPQAPALPPPMQKFSDAPIPEKRAWGAGAIPLSVTAAQPQPAGEDEAVKPQLADQVTDAKPQHASATEAVTPQPAGEAVTSAPATPAAEPSAPKAPTAQVAGGDGESEIATSDVPQTAMEPPARVVVSQSLKEAAKPLNLKFAATINAAEFMPAGIQPAELPNTPVVVKVAGSGEGAEGAGTATATVSVPTSAPASAPTLQVSPAIPLPPAIQLPPAIKEATLTPETAAAHTEAAKLPTPQTSAESSTPSQVATTAQATPAQDSPPPHHDAAQPGVAAVSAEIAIATSDPSLAPLLETTHAVGGNAAMLGATPTWASRLTRATLKPASTPSTPTPVVPITAATAATVTVAKRVSAASKKIETAPQEAAAKQAITKQAVAGKKSQKSPHYYMCDIK